MAGSRRRTAPRLGAEQLEPRQLLAGDLGAVAEVILPEAAGLGQVDGLTLARQVEYLTRGVNVSSLGAGRAYVDWRLLGTDPGEIAFNLYRVSGSGTAE